MQLINLFVLLVIFALMLGLVSIPGLEKKRLDNEDSYSTGSISIKSNDTVLS